MKTAILACKTLRHEIEKACEKHNIDYPIHWIESGLHNYPEKLHKYIQDELDNMQDYDRVILTFGLCGNSLVGVEGERNLWVEYQYTIEKYGEETGKEIFDMMLNHYKSLGVIDTKCYDLDEVMPLCKEIADTLELNLKILDYPISYLEDLLTGPWDDDRFVITKPNSKIKDFALDL